ncbi:9909_t:CDS:2 [Entrophospora sp. SA101]|nr:9909_t:CDS:2 [Entrophospora sp. SA101]
MSFMNEQRERETIADEIVKDINIIDNFVGELHHQIVIIVDNNVDGTEEEEG